MIGLSNAMISIPSTTELMTLFGSALTDGSVTVPVDGMVVAIKFLSMSPQANAGGFCQSSPVKGRKRCRMHGGTSPGAPKGPSNGAWKHGLYTKEAISLRRAISAEIRSSRRLLKAI